jgi:hypothetical protein
MIQKHIIWQRKKKGKTVEKEIKLSSLHETIERSPKRATTSNKGVDFGM